MERTPSPLRAYARAFTSDWINMMSGLASLILGVVAAAADRALPSWTFWAASLACFLFASYRVWLARFKRAEEYRTLLFAAMDDTQRTAADAAHRKDVLARLRDHYVMVGDDLTEGILSGVEPLPKEWVEEQLAKMGETWRQDVYR